MAGFLNHYPPYPVNGLNMPPRTADMFSPMVAPPYGKSQDFNFIFRHERTHALWLIRVAIVLTHYGNDNSNEFAVTRRIVFSEEGSFLLCLSCVKYFERSLKPPFVSSIFVYLMCFLVKRDLPDVWIENP